MQLRRFVLSQPAEALLLDDGANLGESFLDHVLGHRATFARKLAQQMRNLVHIPVEQIEPITTLFTKQFAEYFGLFAAAVEHVLQLSHTFPIGKTVLVNEKTCVVRWS